MMEARAVIVGAGFAGSSTAYHLVRRGLGPVVLLEREVNAGMHSSGRNAAMVRQVVPDPAIARLAREGGRWIQSLSGTSSGAVGFQQCGSLLIASGDRVGLLDEEAARGREAGLVTRRLTSAQAVERVGVLQGADFEEGCYCPSDGVVDIAALLQHYLRGAREGGARFIFGEELSEILVKNGRVVGVRAGDLEISTDVVMNAAGAWASDVAERAGALSIPFRSLRRHLMYTGPYPRASRDWPFVWDVSHEVYFRPESGGLLLCPCDEVPDQPGLPEVDPGALDLLHQKLSHHLPGLMEIPVARTWAGLRVFAPDRSFVIGPDPLLEGFFWVAGLGGHGVTTSAAVGALAAELRERPERDEDNPFSPRRFLGGC